jgi:hypothetical protein
MRQWAKAALAGATMAWALAPATGMAQSAPAAVPAPAAAPASLPAAAPAARPADVASVDAIVKALYEVISGPAGAPRDWDRMRSLFAPGARMMAIGVRKDGSIGTRAMTPDDYIAANSKVFATTGFFETELARTTDAFGQLVHVFSTYEARHAPGDAKPFMRGINSIQLVNDGSRWHVLSLAWRAEDPTLSLPERYLQSR